MRTLLLAACLLFGYSAKAQNIGADLSRILELAPVVPGTDSTAIAARDEVVSLLAYYAGAPDIQRVYQLTFGRNLMDYYSTNQPMREFLLETGLASYLEDHIVQDRYTYLEPLFEQDRGRFLEKKEGTKLFTDGPLNLERIRQSVTAPKTEEFSLAAASRTAATNGALTPQDLVSNALVGLSDFIAKRAQAELTYTFLERLREYLNRNDLNYLFPETAGYLPELDLLNYKAILPSIRRAFAQDLNAVSFNLGNFLEARDAGSFRSPAIYNIFLIYRILDLELREVPLPDVISFTASEIARSRAAVRSEIDIKLTVGAENSPAYETLIQAFGEYAGAVQELNANVEGELDGIDEELSRYLDTLAELDMSPELADAYINRMLEVTTFLTNPKTPLAQSRLSAETALVNNGIVLKWLQGEEAYEYYESYPSFTKFDEFFGPNAESFDAAARRAAGLSAVRQILAQESALEDYREQYTGMTQMRTDLFDLQRAFMDSLTRARYAEDPTQLYGEAVGKKIDAALEDGEHPALLLLVNLLLESPWEEEAAYAHIRSVETRLEEWLSTNRSPEEKQLPAAAQSRIPGSIATTAEAYQRLRNAMIAFNRAQIKDDLYRSYQNLTTFETIFGIGQQSFFLLAGNNNDLFIDKEGMSVFQTDANARQLLAGIVQERFNRIEALGEINVAGMITFLLDFSLYLSEINRQQTLSKVSVEASGEVRPGPSGIQFISGTLERLLTAPILQKPGFLLDDEDRLPAESIADRYGAFRKVPAVNRELRELFQLTVDRDYRYAIDNLLNLIQLLDVFPESGKKRQRLETRRHQLLEERRQLLGLALDEDGYAFTDEMPVAVIDPDLIYTTEGDKENYEEEIESPLVDTTEVKSLDRQLAQIDNRLAKLDPVASRKFQENLFKYGTFMSDVVAANTPAGIEAALNNIALPPGSSQVKRTRPSSIEIGAYFGAAVARERLVLPAEETEESFTDPATVVSLFVPVGLSYSRQLGGRSSATLFASLLDLGAVTAFRIEDRNSGGFVERLPQFNLRNVVAPGLHLMYNLPRSPFTLGFGVQDGPNVREYRPFGVDEAREARSLRFMLTASVDVPLFRLGGG